MPSWTMSKPLRGLRQRCSRVAVRIATAAATLTVTSIVAAADEPVSTAWMNADAIRSEFSGKALAGVYPGGKTWAEDIFDDGKTDYREAGVRRPGQWWTTKLEFCFSYPEPGVGGCFRISKVSANCYELYDYSSEFGRAEVPPPGKGSWNGLMWRAQTQHTCEDAASS